MLSSFSSSRCVCQHQTISQRRRIIYQTPHALDGRPPLACTSCMFVTECYCGDKAPVWDTKEVFCELKCEDNTFEGKNCGGWGFMSVFELSRPALSYGSLAPTGKGATYEGCYNAKPNRKLFNKFVTSSEWMTNKVRWRRFTLVGGRSSQSFVIRL